MRISLRYLFCFLCGLTCVVFNYGCTCDPVEKPRVWTISPEDGAIINDPEVTLIWNYSFFRSDNVYHSVFTGTSPDDMTLIVETNENDTTHIWTALEPMTTYYWAVTSWTYEYESYTYAYSDTVSFTTADVFSGQGKVHSPYPDSGSLNVDSILTMYWSCYNPSEEDYSFDVYLGTTVNPSRVDIGLTDTVRNLDTLTGGMTYYWRVVSYSGIDTIEGDLWQFTTRYPAGTEMFALLEVDARQSPSGYHVEEIFRARFDSTNAPGAPVIPLQADSVYGETIKLIWDDVSQSYSYTEWSIPVVENGQPAEFRVYGNIEVPNLVANIVFPACTLGIVSPQSFETVSINGFEVLWDGSECGGTIYLTLMSGNDSTGVIKYTDNDGIDSLTAADLAPLGGQTGVYNLVVFKRVQQNINAIGYMPQSIIRARAINVMEQINIY